MGKLRTKSFLSGILVPPPLTSSRFYVHAGLFCSLCLVLRGTTVLSFTVMGDLIIHPFHNFCLCASLFFLFTPSFKLPQSQVAVKAVHPEQGALRNETLRSLSFIPCLGEPFTRECQGLIIVKIIKNAQRWRNSDEGNNAKTKEGTEVQRINAGFKERQRCKTLWCQSINKSYWLWRLFINLFVHWSVIHCFY